MSKGAEEKVKLLMITKENAGEFSGLFDEALLQNEPIVGAGCLDDEENPIGAALLDSDGERLIISSIVVEEESRRQGAGSLMLDGIMEMSEAAGTDTVEAYFTGEEAENFYINNGFLVSEAAPIYMINAGRLAKNPSLQKEIKKGRVSSLKELSNSAKGKLTKILGEKGYLSLPDQYDENLSFVCTDEKGNPVAFILSVYLFDDDIIRVEHLVNLDPGHPENVMDLLIAGVSGLKSNFVSPDTNIEFVSVNDKVFRFIEKTVGGEENIKSCGSLLHAVKATVTQEG